MSEKFDFHDISSSNRQLVADPPQKGCVLTPVKGFLIFLGVVAVGVAVGLGVYFGHPDCQTKCDDNVDPTVGPTMDMSTPGTTEAGQITDIRLPGNIRANHYDISLIPDIYQDDPEDFTSSGSVEMHFTVMSQTDTVIVHYRDLEITVGYVKQYGSDDDIVDGDATKDTEREFFKIPVKKDMMVEGKNYTVKLSFTGPIKKDLKGIYYSDYEVNGTTRYLLTSQLQSTDARKVFPCLDEPALKASFAVRVQRKEGMTTYGNSEINQTNDVAEKPGWKEDVYDTTVPMSTYLLAFTISDFKCIQNTASSGKTVDICARPNAQDQAEFAASIATEMQEFFERYHYVDYPLPKTIHVAVPDFSAGAMENWGLIIYRETALLYDPATAAAYNKQRVAVVISHELAHMWFGNLVTCEWWDDIWLNEGFASYMEVLGVHNTSDFNTWEMHEQFVIDSLQRVLVLDSLQSSHPVYQTVNHPDQIAEIFDIITYNKGSSVIRMMRNFLGEETFRNGMSKYLKANEYGTATHQKLFQFLKEETSNSINVPKIMDTWIKQTGYPVVMFDYDKTLNKVTVTQKRFLLDSTAASEATDETWEVPVNYVTSTSADTDRDNPSAEDIEWLEQTANNIELTGVSGDWVLGNVQEQFFYRVNYNRENWDALVKQLQEEHTKFHQINRAQIIDDAFNLARAGVEPVDTLLAMNTTIYMNKEENYVPWRALSNNIGYISNMMVVSPKYGYMKEFMKSILASQHDRLGWNEDTGTDPHIDQRLRSVILSMACSNGLDTCVSNATQAFKTFMDGDESISPNLRYALFCNGIRYGSDKEWNYAYQRYLTSNSAAEQSTLLQSLACTNSPWLLRGYLQKALDGEEIRSQDMGTVFVNVARNANGRTLVWNMFRANWDDLFEKFGNVAFRLSSMVSGITESFNTQWELDELEKFMEENPDQGAAKRSFEQAVEKTKSNIKWMEKNKEILEEWLESNFGSSL